MGTLDRPDVPTSPTDWLFHPEVARLVVLARRPAGADAVRCVVSDAVWGDVVRLLRWAASADRSAPDVAARARWRLAVDCYDLMRRLPTLIDEVDEQWVSLPDDPLPDDAPAPAEQLREVAAELTAALVADAQVSLFEVGLLVNRLGAAAIAASVDGADWSELG
ncbi:hypothetical protein GB931_12190 [Modestobacter sp. I12A-02628]|uniref:Uncharacterized protein n=1 Tax=Goekera deserti TaxID=2497753 RepID=A0A7K3W9F2_9ACTN|nr:hypothetical protein [Goekera deserti]MPQ98666.1 hypothetical protein [Goekera deserti]NDI49228.1 hypothetical protein [Goekera deserti]NEL52966.1 hypothetical protein [Goekera deserti]